MFDKIVTNSDPYRGPATGHSGGEHGDNWNDAVAKINNGFENVINWITGFDPDATAKVAEAPMSAEEIGMMIQQAVQPLQDELQRVRMETEANTAKLAIWDQYFNQPVEGVPANMDPVAVTEPGPNGEGSPVNVEAPAS